MCEENARIDPTFLIQATGKPKYFEWHNKLTIQMILTDCNNRADILNSLLNQLSFEEAA
ncbi:MAG: hypothetical protein OEZ38_01815 [Gammaproteobacteria bacterium]|nr:hypothetical protein [Gammaproteobacteria bacterium]